MCCVSSPYQETQIAKGSYIAITSKTVHVYNYFRL